MTFNKLNDKVVTILKRSRLMSELFENISYNNTSRIIMSQDSFKMLLTHSGWCHTYSSDTFRKNISACRSRVIS